MLPDGLSLPPFVQDPDPSTCLMQWALSKIRIESILDVVLKVSR
jgi:hypothetical protein